MKTSAAIALLLCCGPALANVSFFNNTLSTSGSITGHAGIIAGDLLIYVDAAETSGVCSTSTPTGFTSIAGLGAGGDRCFAVSYKLAAGTEASASIAGMDGDVTDQKILAVFRPDAAASALTLEDPGSQATAGDPTPQTVTAASGAVPLVVGCVYGSSGVIDPRTLTVGGSGAKDGEIDGSNNLVLWFAYKAYNSSPADVVCDMEDEASNFLMSFYIEVTEGGGSPSIIPKVMHHRRQLLR